MNIRKLSFFFLMGLFSFSLTAQTLDMGPKSLLPDDEPAARWFASIAIGGGVPIDPLIALSEALADGFTNAQGGRYRVAFQLDDLGRGSANPTTAVLEDAFEKLGDEVRNFKASSSNTPTMMMLSLTGHGMTRDGKYYFYAGDGEAIEGSHLAQMIFGIEVDELVLIVQSCQSGTLVDTVFPELVKFLKAEAVKRAESKSRQIAIVTPVPGSLNSPFYSWEEVVRASIEAKDTDSNQSGLVSIGEWMNFMMRAAASHEHFVPFELIDLAAKVRQEIPMGILPHFFFHGFDERTPMFFTEGFEGRIQWPSYRGGLMSPQFTPETIQFYRERAAAVLRNPRSVGARVPMDEARRIADALEAGRQTPAICRALMSIAGDESV